jgi:hypothetical protein
LDTFIPSVVSAQSRHGRRTRIRQSLLQAFDPRGCLVQSSGRTANAICLRIKHTWSGEQAIDLGDTTRHGLYGGSLGGQSFHERQFLR